MHVLRRAHWSIGSLGFLLGAASACGLRFSLWALRRRLGASLSALPMPVAAATLAPLIPAAVAIASLAALAGLALTFLRAFALASTGLLLPARLLLPCWLLCTATPPTTLFISFAAITLGAFASTAAPTLLVAVPLAGVAASLLLPAASLLPARSGRSG